MTGEEGSVSRGLVDGRVPLREIWGTLLGLYEVVSDTSPM
jgi:hypothetical protein